jgi:hypothetical protein
MGCTKEPGSRVEMGYNTSTISMWVVEGDEIGAQYLGVTARSYHEFCCYEIKEVKIRLSNSYQEETNVAESYNKIFGSKMTVLPTTTMMIYLPRG